MYRLLLITLLLFQLFHGYSAGCSGQVDLPLQMSQPSTHVRTGAKTYAETNINALARHLVTDIPGLSMDYARIMAEDALYIEENYEITYSFFISSGTARLSQFKIISTTLGNKQVNINWNILKATLTYTAHKDITIHRNRRRRRWLFGGRRRCTRQKRPRGVKKFEIARMQSSLTSVLNRVGQKPQLFVLKRTHGGSRKTKVSTGKCLAWKPVINLKINRMCMKRTGAIPRPYTKPRPLSTTRKIFKPPLWRRLRFPPHYG